MLSDTEEIVRKNAAIPRVLVDWEPAAELDQDGNVTQTWDPTWESEA